MLYDDMYNPRVLLNSKNGKNGGDRLNPHHCCPKIICHYGDECGTTGYAPCCFNNGPTMDPTDAPTYAPTTAPTYAPTFAPTYAPTYAPTTPAPTTPAPTTPAPTTPAPTTPAPTTPAPTTPAPTTPAPTTPAPTTPVPTTPAPTAPAHTCATYNGLHGIVGDREIEVCCDSRCGVCGGEGMT